MRSAAVVGGRARCPNCDETFGVAGRSGELTMEDTEQMLVEAILRHFLAEHPGQAIGAGTTETA